MAYWVVGGSRFYITPDIDKFLLLGFDIDLDPPAYTGRDVHRKHHERQGSE